MGKFCVFEGLDGSGKTTLAKEVAEILAEKYLVFFLDKYAQPAIGDLISKEMKKYSPNLPYLALLFAADRVFYTKFIEEKVIRDDSIVIADRYFFSSIVYQGYLSTMFEEEVSPTWVETINRHCLIPDKIIYTYAPIDVLVERISRRSGVLDVYENRECLERAQQFYELELRKYANLVLPIDTTLPVKENIEKILNFVTI